MVFLGQEIRRGSDGWSLLRVSDGHAVKSLTGAASSEGSTGAGGSASVMAHSHGCWQEASVPYHMYPSTELLEHTYDMAAVFPQSKQSKRETKMKPP